MSCNNFPACNVSEPQKIAGEEKIGSEKGISDVKVGIIGGSGLDNPEIISNRTEKRVTTPYGDPSDSLILGDIEGVPVAILARHGRKHDTMPSNVNYRANIWALKEEGCTHIVATNACGSLQEDIPPGTLVIIDNFIDRTYNRKQTFHDGEPNHPKGICHMPMEPAFCEHTRKVILETAKDVGVEVRDGGTVVAIEGPRFSSKAESNMFRSWGAHVIGMTTVPEVVLAKEAGLCYAVIAMATDYDCWRTEGEKVSHKFVLSIFHQNVNKVLKLLVALVPRMAKEDWTKTKEEAQIGVIGGSGLDNPEIISHKTEKRMTTPYGNPSDSLILGEIENVPVAILARHGRKHDIIPSNVNYRANIWALKEVGCTHIVATNACGSLQEDILPGSLVIIDNFIDWTYGRKQTFYDGEFNHPKGICHMPMEPAFCQHTRKIILETAKDVSIEVRDGGTIIVEEGPDFCSKAESNMFRSWGAHLVGMTTAPEIVLAKEAGLCYAAIAMATDYDCWREEGEKVTHKLVLSIFQQNVNKILKLLVALIPRMAKEDWTKTIETAQALVKDSVMGE